MNVRDGSRICSPSRSSSGFNALSYLCRRACTSTGCSPCSSTRCCCWWAPMTEAKTQRGVENLLVVVGIVVAWLRCSCWWWRSSWSRLAGLGQGCCDRGVGHGCEDAETKRECCDHERPRRRPERLLKGCTRGWCAPLGVVGSRQVTLRQPLCGLANEEALSIIGSKNGGC